MITGRRSIPLDAAPPVVKREGKRHRPRRPNEIPPDWALRLPWIHWPRTGQGPVRLLLAPVQVYVRRVPLALTPRYVRFVMPGGEWRKQISPRKEKIAWDIDFAFFMPEWSTENIGL